MAVLLPTVFTILFQGGLAMERSDRENIFAEDVRSNFLFCLHCERAYERGKWRNVGDLQRCPYLNCDGDTVMDAMDWELIRDQHPEYPATPDFGRSYPMY